jgi:hypothetical protein
VIGLSTTRAPQYTQARWLTAPDTLSFSQQIPPFLPLLPFFPQRSNIEALRSSNMLFFT